MSALEASFCASVFLFVYPFTIYPWVLSAVAARARLRPRQEKPRTVVDGLPSVAVVICALNEQKVIREKLRNCLDLDYPKDRLRIILISDGSTDATARIGREYEPHGVQVIEQIKRRGKITNLNEVVPALHEEIIVLSDANVMYHPAALRRLTERLEDPSVGCVSGKVVLTDTTEDLDASTKDYYSLEWRLQEDASALYAMPGADGAMYAFRRELFRPCPNDTLIEDFIIAIAVIRQGKRVVFESQALGWEKGVTSLNEEFRRKVRIAAGAAQGLCRGNAWPHSAPASFWFIFISHKLLRWFSPVVGLVVVSLAICLASPMARLVAAGFLLMIILAALRILTRQTHRLLDAPFYFLFNQFAVGLGLIKGFTGTQSVLWAKADR